MSRYDNLSPELMKQAMEYQDHCFEVIKPYFIYGSWMWQAAECAMIDALTGMKRLPYNKQTYDHDGTWRCWLRECYRISRDLSFERMCRRAFSRGADILLECRYLGEDGVQRNVMMVRNMLHRIFHANYKGIDTRLADVRIDILTTFLFYAMVDDHFMKCLTEYREKYPQLVASSFAHYRVETLWHRLQDLCISITSEEFMTELTTNADLKACFTAFANRLKDSRYVNQVLKESMENVGGYEDALAEVAEEMSKAHTESTENTEK